MKSRIYLDHNSTTPIHPDVAKSIFDCHLEQLANPASQHLSGQKARSKLETLRRSMLDLIGANTKGMNADRLILTSGGTESNNLALLGLAGDQAGKVLVSAVEHPSVHGPTELLKRRGFEVRSLPVDQDGVCDLDAAQQMIDCDTRVVSLMLANNETGVIQPVHELSQYCQTLGVSFHCDATQAIGKIPVSFDELGCDAMTFSAHKFYGPRGIGGLVLKSSCNPEPLLLGGFQQMGIRPGTEDVALAAGMHAALKMLVDDLTLFDRVRELRDLLERRLVEEQGAIVNGSKAVRLPHTSNISFPGIDRQAFLMAADMAGLDISTGSACASGSSEPSPVLMAMGLEEDVIKGSLRVSLGLGNTLDEIEEAIARSSKILSQFKAAN